MVRAPDLRSRGHGFDSMAAKTFAQDLYFTCNHIFKMFWRMGMVSSQLVCIALPGWQSMINHHRFGRVPKGYNRIETFAGTIHPVSF